MSNLIEVCALAAYIAGLVQAITKSIEEGRLRDSEELVQETHRIVDRFNKKVVELQAVGMY